MFSIFVKHEMLNYFASRAGRVAVENHSSNPASRKSFTHSVVKWQASLRSVLRTT
jgi:hypothetical protein